LPVLWARWLPSRRRGRAPQILGELLAAAASDTELMLDLKGRRKRLAWQGRRGHRGRTGRRGKNGQYARVPGGLLEPFMEPPSVSVVHSVGSPPQLRALAPALRRPALWRGSSVISRLPDPERNRGGICERVRSWIVS
jgi:hypothetical protein